MTKIVNFLHDWQPSPIKWCLVIYCTRHSIICKKCSNCNHIICVSVAVLRAVILSMPWYGGTVSHPEIACIDRMSSAILLHPSAEAPMSQSMSFLGDVMKIGIVIRVCDKKNTIKARFYFKPFLENSPQINTDIWLNVKGLTDGLKYDILTYD